MCVNHDTPQVLHFREQLGIEAVVVPGVSAVFSAPLLGGIPVTHRGLANQVVLSTGYGKDPGAQVRLQPYHHEQTAVYLMAVGRIRELCDRLQAEAGYPSDCPAAIVERASTQQQRVVAGTVRTLAAMADEFEVKPPATIVFGSVVEVLNGQHQGHVQVRATFTADEDSMHPGHL